MAHPIVFTDLDGTLLDHETYDHSSAQPALAALAARDIPVIPVTSKTSDELRPLMADIGLEGGFIAENGAVMSDADGRLDKAADIADIRTAIDRLPKSLRENMHCFGDMAVAEIAGLTGLDMVSAQAAAARAASEPFIWRGDAPPPPDMLAGHGYGLTRGGRFYHIVPKRDKAAAMQAMMRDMAEAGESWALGDGPNDIAMLLAADRAALIANPHLTVLPALPPDHGLYKTRQVGPQGWCDAIAFFLGEEIG